MATLVDYGAGPEHKLHMHPFFRKASATDASSSNRPPSRTLEGDSSVGDNSTNHNEDPGYTSSDVAHTEAAEITTGGKWSVDEGDDLEYENTRIKRRRVSAGPNHPPSETTNSPSTHPTTMWHDQLQAAAQAYVGAGLGCAEDQTVAGPSLSSDKEGVIHSPLPILSKDGSSWTERPILSAQLPPNGLSNSSDIDLTGSPTRHPPLTGGAMGDQFSDESKPSPTPPKKVLRSGHGKLVFSPKKSPKHASRTVASDASGETSDANKTTNISKKLEMKNGRLVSSLRVTLSYSAPESGAKITEILSNKSKQSGNQVSQAKLAQGVTSSGRATHPFFRGRLSGNAQKQSDLKSETSSDETTSKSKAPKPWKDIIFESKKTLTNRNAPSLPPVWPPADIQHVRPSQFASRFVTIRTVPLSRPKSKQHALRVDADEDVLWTFSRRLTQEVDKSLVRAPVRKVMSGKELVRLTETLYGMDSLDHRSDSISRLEVAIESTRSSFDRGMAAGPQLWCHEYAPTCWQEILEPQAKVLHDWLSNLKVHQVQTGKLLPLKAKPPTPKKRRKRKSDEMDDFIAFSDDDDARSAASSKNAILLTGPPGSGKTASVFAVAQQLGFEVFEIHPGMRRSARDIQDKVGDMTQNHLVQHSDTSSRRSSISLEAHDTVCSTSGPLPENRNSLANFMGIGKGGQQSKIAEVKDAKDSKTKSQKQSLVLFEEVDNLFEEDKGFWSGVQSLIRTSKRPVILTCNSVDSVPVADLDLFAVLCYGCPEWGTAVQLLGSICAAEGHLLSKEALESLYFTKGQDLRASIMELNLWCQMTVGSQQGGLDWMLPDNDEFKLKPDGSVTRTVSQDTFTRGLDLLPKDFDDTEGLIRFSQDSLGIPALDWVQNDMWSGSTEPTRLSMLTDMLILSEARSAMDLIDDTTTPTVASALWKLSHPAPADASACPPRSNEIIGLYLSGLNESQHLPSSIYRAFEPLQEEPRIGLPSSPGRKAPSLDNPSAISLVTEVAPYIRYVVSHDQRLEQLRNELHGTSQHGAKRQRRTRAARAALEGGDKGTVRRDKWFPEDLDWSAVMRTGNEWPQARDMDVWDNFAAQTPSSSMGMEVESDELASQRP